MISRFFAALGLLFFLCAAAFGAAVKVPYSGRLAQNGTLVNGTAQFKFVLIDASNGQSIWSNDNTSTNGSEPTSAVSLTVSNGLYSVLLGDTSLTNMTTLDQSVFATTNLKLRVFVNGEQLAPDVELGTSPYAANANALNGLDSSALLQLSGGTMTGPLTVNGNVSLGADAGNNTISLGNNSGDTLTLNGTIVGASPFILEGAAVNGNKLTLSLAEPTGSRTILFPDASGTVAVSAAGPLGLSATGNLTCSTCVTSGSSLTNNAVVIGGGSQGTSTIAVNTTSTHALFATAGAPSFRALTASDLPASFSNAALTINNNAANNTTSIGTGTTTGAITIGGGANTVTINSANWDISSGGNFTTNGSLTADIVQVGTNSIIAGAGFTGNGAGLNSLNASNLTTGTVPNSRTTGTSSNSPNTLVLRGVLGGFSAGSSDFAGSVTITSGQLRISAGTTQTPTNGATILTNDGRIKVAGSGGAVTAVMGAGTVDGTIVYLQGTNDTNTVTIADSGNANLVAARTLGSGDMLVLIWDNANSKWLEVSFSNN